MIVPAGMEMIHICGQTPEDLDGSVPESYMAQAELAWRNVARTLEAAQCSITDLVKVTMFVRDRCYREENRAVRDRVLGDHRPALTVIVADHWDERWLIEIEATAARPAAESELAL
jgi:2-iminobutanoate/2-iminopropanoate deaminase